MFRQQFENLPKIEYVVGRVLVEDDGDILVCGDVDKTLDSLIEHLDEPFWSRTASLCHNEPLEEACGRVGNRERDNVFVNRDLVE